MVEELKPYQLVQTYTEARHSRVNSWVFGALAATSAIAGFGTFINTDLPDQIRYGASLGLWSTSLILVNRGSVASKQANIYSKRVAALEGASEDSYLYNLMKSVQPGLAPIALTAQLETTGSPEADAVLQCLADYDVESRFEKAIKGPTFTRLFLKPAKGQKVSGIMNLGAELQLALGLENPPIVSVKPSGLAVDIPNSTRSTLKFSQYMEFQERSPLEPLLLAVGVDLDGRLIELDLSDPNTCHVLGGGTTGSGKSEFLRTAVLSLIGRYSPDSVMLAIADPKRVTFNEFEGCPWMLAPIAKSPDDISMLLSTLTGEMDRRYELLEEEGVSDISSYNRESSNPIPRIVLLFDEYAEALDQSDKEESASIQKNVRRLAQKARAAGIHILIFTQRPDANKLDPQLRSNLPASIGLKVQRIEESQIIMGVPNSGAENLLGKGDLLLRAGNEVVRLQAPLVDSPILVRRAISRYQSPAIAPASSPTLQQFSDEFQTSDPREMLEKLFQQSGDDASMTADQLSLNVERKLDFEIDDVLPELQPVVRYSLKKGWVKASDVKRDVRSLKGVSTEIIREYFILLKNQGIGTTRGEGEMVQYNALEG